MWQLIVELHWCLFHQSGFSKSVYVIWLRDNVILHGFPILNDPYPFSLKASFVWNKSHLLLPAVSAYKSPHFLSALNNSKRYFYWALVAITRGLIILPMKKGALWLMRIGNSKPSGKLITSWLKLSTTAWYAFYVSKFWKHWKWIMPDSIIVDMKAPLQ